MYTIRNTYMGCSKFVFHVQSRFSYSLWENVSHSIYAKVKLIPLYIRSATIAEPTSKTRSVWSRQHRRNDQCSFTDVHVGLWVGFDTWEGYFVSCICHICCFDFLRILSPTNLAWHGKSEELLLLSPFFPIRYWIQQLVLLFVIDNVRLGWMLDVGCYSREE